jgi:2-polyprenyl-6-methoxyphenol hydroxylase-like FAD-dependent oxidoreductase
MTTLREPGPAGDIDIEQPDVLVVGGGPVGLAATAGLGTRGLRVLTVDAGDGAATYPTAESIDTRSMEWLRQLGIADAVRDSGFPDDFPRDIAFVTRLSGYELTRFRRPGNRARLLPTAGLSPEGAVWWPKFWFDTALRDRALQLPNVQLRYRWRCAAVTQTSRGVIAHLVRPDGTTRQVTAPYLVGCDGARSSVRRGLGIRMEGSPAEAVWEGAFAEIPGLLDAIDLPPTVQYYTLRPRRAIFGSLDGKELWRITYPLAAGEEPTPGEVIATIRECAGLPGLAVTLRDTRLWTGHTIVASSFRRGRVFLAGDAAHQMWPSGGHGMNTGIGDVHNLSWKLAAVLRGEAGEGLLDSYEAERKPVAVRNTSRAAFNYQADLALTAGPVLDDPGAAGEAARASVAAQVAATREREWRSLGVQLGYRYENSPAVVPDGTPEPPDNPSRYQPACRAGHRAPHLELPGGRSVLDLFGRGFVLLQATPAAPASAWAAAFRARGAPLELADISAARPGSRYPAELVLVRPDGFVAWAGAAADTRVGEVADTVLGLAAAGQHSAVISQRSAAGGRRC